MNIKLLCATVPMLLVFLLVACSLGDAGLEPTGPPRLLEGASVVLALSSGATLDNPSDEQIHRALSSLDVAADGEGFAILGRTAMTYLQVSGDQEIGFAVEYQVDDVDHHYRARREDFSLQEVVAAFSAYRDGKPDWWHSKEWVRLTW